jgi:hypothetical protein
MIAEKITGALAVLGDLAGRVTPEVWEVLHCALRELRDAADQAGVLEGRVTADTLNCRIAQDAAEAEGAKGIAHV